MPLPCPRPCNCWPYNLMHPFSIFVCFLLPHNIPHLQTLRHNLEKELGRNDSRRHGVKRSVSALIMHAIGSVCYWLQLPDKKRLICYISIHSSFTILHPAFHHKHLFGIYIACICTCKWLYLLYVFFFLCLLSFHYIPLTTQWPSKSR